MQLSEVVRRRRMVRAFTAEPVPWETVERLLRTAQRAPSAGYSQGISFVVVTGDEGRRAIADLAGE
ncbi:MAG TPA: nitroreductase family protein, partial [Chloroflexota bacterium]|nr:nitroreductase family protein [Chloroflexota bacterium]